MHKKAVFSGENAAFGVSRIWWFNEPIAY